MAAAKRLDVGVLLEGRAGLVGLRQAELLGRFRLDAERADQVGELAQLAGIVAGDDNRLVRLQVSFKMPQIRGSANSSELPDGSRK
jgi:hypothetical protein